MTGAPPVSAECAGLLHELQQLRARSARAREESAALGEAALWAGARTLATRDAMWHNRLQWRAWRAGWALWRQRAGETPRAPRICFVCEAVSFTQGPHAGGAADSGDETWVTVPAAIRERFRSQDPDLGLVSDVCPRCAVDEPWRQEVARLLLQVFATVDAMAAEMAAAMPWIDPADALDRTLAEAVERLRTGIPPAAMSAFVDAVRGLVQRLRTESPQGGSPLGETGLRETGPGSRGAPDRFQPALRYV